MLVKINMALNVLTYVSFLPFLIGDELFYLMLLRLPLLSFLSSSSSSLQVV